LSAEASDGKHRIQRAAGIGRAESIEGTILRNLIRRVQKATPRRARQGTTDADAANAEIGDLRDAETLPTLLVG
jgi:hypothetical protein